MRSALRKRSNGLACAAAAHFPASTHRPREHVPAPEPMQPSHPTIGSGR
ncbi:hypothetical protein ACFY3J_17450 [Streptomyces sp. NPDC001231]